MTLDISGGEPDRDKIGNAAHDHSLCSIWSASACRALVLHVSLISQLLESSIPPEFVGFV
jgi:hypothetical protein